MLIENYKGIEIWHNATKDEFYTNVVIRKSTTGKADEFIRNGRLQATRDQIDKFLNTAAKKPIVKKVWLSDDYEEFNLVEIIIYNAITNTVSIQSGGSKNRQVIKLSEQSWREKEKLFLDCKENAAIISVLTKKKAEKDKIKKEISCSSGKLIPLKIEHFV